MSAIFKKYIFNVAVIKTCRICLRLTWNNTLKITFVSLRHITLKRAVYRDSQNLLDKL